MHHHASRRTLARARRNKALALLTQYERTQQRKVMQAAQRAHDRAQQGEGAQVAVDTFMAINGAHIPEHLF